MIALTVWNVASASPASYARELLHARDVKSIASAIARACVGAAIAAGALFLLYGSLPDVLRPNFSWFGIGTFLTALCACYLLRPGPRAPGYGLPAVLSKMRSPSGVEATMKTSEYTPCDVCIVTATR